ncbi:response regulator [Spirosoma sp. BT702]|uniref:histidine kinase n=1 Tax=Spirosoma profusum TaxID=2771354 RepID=A0A926XVQ5_9BACT|nr:ATP-binding protein [Spirosoma profusum]MBD2701569.1 response regulator [Spirosoma profusum]
MMTRAIGRFVLLLTLMAQSIHAQVSPFSQSELITDRQGLPQAFVSGIVQDRQGFIWVATRDGLCRYDGQQFKVFQPDPNGRPSLSFAGVNDLTLDHWGRIWITCDDNSIDIVDPKTERFTHFSRQPAYKKWLGNQKPTHFHIDRRNRLWMVLPQPAGLICINLTTKQAQRYEHSPGSSGVISGTLVTSIAESTDGAIWVGTDRGLDRFDETTRRFQPYRNGANLSSALPEGRVYDIGAMPTGELLVATHQALTCIQKTGQRHVYPMPAVQEYKWHGLHFVADSRGTIYFELATKLCRFTKTEGVQILTKQEPDVNLRQKEGLSLWVDRSDVLWEGTNGSGIRKYDLRPNPFLAAPYHHSFHVDLLTPHWLGGLYGQFPPQSVLQNLSSYLFRYTLDKQQNLWWNAGSSDVYRLNRQTRTTDRLRLPVTFSTKDTEGIPCPLATDPQGQVWAVYDSLVWQYSDSQANWQLSPFRIPVRQTGQVMLVVVDDAAFWLATYRTGLWRLDRRTGQLRHYANQPGNVRSMSSNVLYSMAPDPQHPNRLWIGTFGSGLCAFDKRTGESRRFTVTEGLPNNVIYSVLPVGKDALWLGTNKGICRFNTRTFTTRNFTRDDGILADEFNRYHYIQLPDNRIVMGGLEGITAFNPNRIDQDTFAPPVELTDLQINNEPASATLLDSLPIQAVTQITLPYNQNFITARFAALQFNRRNKNRYRYRLEGLEETWKITDQPLATYTNLPSDHYVLLLNASNTSGRWSHYVRRLDITIRPPLWATWWAYVLYSIAIFGLIYGLLRLWVNRIKLQQSVRLNQQEAEQLRETNAMKTRFFANITHEFRTPLTLILAPTEQLVSENSEPRTRRRLLTIEQNAHQLLRLINQLLDLSRLEANVMPLHESAGELTECIANWLFPLTEAATTQGITLTFDSNVAGSHWFDAAKLERIVYNLTANALKFTHTGSISVTLTELDKGVELRVADTGIGIPANQLPHIFDRFYQGRSGSAQAGMAAQSKESENPGTGIGLALVKELVLLQQGTIRVESREQEGTTFFVTLPYRKAEMQTPPSEPDFVHQTEVSDVAINVLVVEDNDELARVITQSLPATYYVRRAVDGQDGLEQALEHGPDLIISDVMMPVQSGPQMDGFELCRQLKTDVRTSHIPVMLLTAKVSLENRLEGLAQGADDYLTKPFYVAELQLRVHNLLEQRRRQRDWLRQQLTQAEPSEATQPAPLPDPFLTQLYATLQANLGNPLFTIEQLADQVAISRGHLHRKVKALTGLSPIELVRNYRLKTATNLLRQGLTSLETADRVGFESGSYFARCFRDLYGITPTEFARTQRSA